MMMGIIIKDLSNKLSKLIDEKNGKVTVDAKWTNGWLSDNGAVFQVRIEDSNGNEIKDAKVAITKKIGP
jgi:hypothetical protein